MIMIKLIVADFDGTLMPFGADAVSERTCALIEAALKKNIVFVVSSGRTYSELISYLPQFADRIWFVCCDGAYYVKGGKTFYEKQIAMGDIDYLFRSNREDVSFVFHGAFDNFNVGDVPEEGRRYGGKTLTRAEARLPKEKIYKITAYGAKGTLAPYGGLRMHWDGGPNAASQYVNRYADKGIALSNLQMRLMITKFETACIGDSGNDVAMMHNAKYSYCIGTRSEALVKCCTHHVESAERALVELID